MINFPNVKDLSLKDLSSQVYLKIKNALPYSTIQLPDRHIVLPGLTILHPLTIIGTPSTTIEIVNGNILVDFRAFNVSDNFNKGPNTLMMPGQDFTEQNKVIISEVTISFKMTTSRLRERLEEYNQKVQ